MVYLAFDVETNLFLVPEFLGTNLFVGEPSDLVGIFRFCSVGTPVVILASFSSNAGERGLAWAHGMVPQLSAVYRDRSGHVSLSLPACPDFFHAAHVGSVGFTAPQTSYALDADGGRHRLLCVLQSCDLWFQRALGSFSSPKLGLMGQRQVNQSRLIRFLNQADRSRLCHQQRAMRE